MRNAGRRGSWFQDAGSCAFCCVGAAGIALWLCSVAGLPLAPAALVLFLTSGLCGGSSDALIPYLSQESLVQARANGAVARMGPKRDLGGGGTVGWGLTRLEIEGVTHPLCAWSTAKSSDATQHPDTTLMSNI